ncbi:MAG: hypothetical protein Q7R96_01340 [Nanoarchaeota archaeon]|nr:hypothetical protein [Nanoarchaeota archaeon]
MSGMCGVCRRNFSSHLCEKCHKDVCEFDWNILAKACIMCVPRSSTVKKSYALPQGN